MAKFLCLAWLALWIAAAPAQAREQLRIVGSSTVFPFAAAAAEQFGRLDRFRTPIVEANGTGGGFKMFCGGVGEDYPDITNASRPIKDSERAQCETHGVRGMAEITLGYDGIVVANQRNAPLFNLTRRHLFLALARHVPVNGTLADNPYTRWREIDATLPDLPIEVYGPPPAEGTRDAFVEMVMQEGCKTVEAYRAAYPEEKVRSQQCGALREDGHYIELLGGNLMVQKLINNANALGIFSYSFLDQNRALVKANPIENVEPTIRNIVSGHYSVARALFMYVKREHLATTPGLKAFAVFLTSDAATGKDGFLAIKGLIPLPEKAHQRAHAIAQEL